MGKLLRILSVFFLIFSIAILALGILLFNKREELKGRTQKLENFMIKVATFVEDEVTDPMPSDFPSRDISDVTAEVIPQDSVNRSDFWKGYKQWLETQDHQTINLGPRRQEMMTYYLRDNTTFEIKRDPMGYRITEGTGTLQDVIDEVNDKAFRQLNLLNETREQLRVVRDELIVVIKELNERKAFLRERLAEIVRLNARLAELEAEIAGLKREIANLKDEIRRLEDVIAQQKDTIVKLEDELSVAKETVEHQRQVILDLRAVVEARGQGLAGDSVLYRRNITPGIKGSVVEVNPDWSFAVLRMDAKFFQEIEYVNLILSRVLTPDQLPGQVPAIDLLVKRGENFETFVAKVRLVQLNPEKGLAVADILGDWMMEPVAVGDTVYY